MPSHTAASALIKFWYLEGHPPWCWPKWQDRTGIRHGLFPEDDLKLPGGWSRKDADDVYSYFEAYNRLPTEDAKIKFATRVNGNTHNPGREIWNNFVKDNWGRWRVHNAVIEELREWDCHPMSIVRRERIPPGSWPDAGAYISKILDTLAMKLFGEEAFVDDSEIFGFEPRKALTIFAQRSWNNIRGQIGYMRNTQHVKEAAASIAFHDLETGPITKAKVNRAIQAVAKWRECAEVSNIAENVGKAKHMLGDLEMIMERLGATIAKRDTAPRKVQCRVSIQALQMLATQEDVTDLLNVYHDYFQLHIDDDNDEIAIPHPDQEDRAMNDLDGDLGIEIEATMSLTALVLALGFRNGLPSQFNLTRHQRGLTPWDYPTIFTSPSSPEISRLEPHWHQLAGVHSIVRSVFSKTKDISHTAGILVADEVGLGKTAQAIMFIAFLNQAIMMESEQHKLPKILGEYRYLWGQERIPSCPHLVLCPGTLINQWVSELRTLFRPKSVDIFIYDSQTDGIAFWGPEGPYQRSLQKPHDRIIVASHSVLFNEMNKTHKRPDRRKVRPWVVPDAKKPLVGSLFSQDFLTVVIDEAHNMRNPGNKHLATLRLLQQARIRLIMTATPLHTTSKDIAAMGRLVGINHFFDEESFEEEKADNAAIRRVKKSDDEDALKVEQLKIVRRLQKRLFGHLLRRTTSSVDWKGRTLLPLPPYQNIKGDLDLSDRELAIINERAEAAKAAVLSASASTRIQSKKFYLEYRTAVGYAKDDPGEPWPRFNSLQDWQAKKSTKMDVCARICKYYLEHDDVSDISFAGGQVVIPNLSEFPLVGNKRMRRILIYSEFASMAPLFQNVLKLYGVDSLTINGQISFDERDKRVKELYDDKHPARVLIFSSVGSAGLNLSIADVIIFFDQPWSSQDEIQIRGRAHRQPQKKNVKVIYLRAKGSADLLMSGVAGGKANMFDAFVKKELGQELQQLLQGCIPDLDEAQSAEAQELQERENEAGVKGEPSLVLEPKSKGEGKSKGKLKSKNKATVETQTSGQDAKERPQEEAKPKSKGSKKSRKNTTNQPSDESRAKGGIEKVAEVDPASKRKRRRRRVLVVEDEAEAGGAPTTQSIPSTSNVSYPTMDVDNFLSSRSTSVASLRSLASSSSSCTGVPLTPQEEHSSTAMVDYSSSSSDDNAKATISETNPEPAPRNEASSRDDQTSQHSKESLTTSPDIKSLVVQASGDEAPLLKEITPDIQNVVPAPFPNLDQSSSSSDEAPPPKKIKSDVQNLESAPSQVPEMIIQENSTARSPSPMDTDQSNHPLSPMDDMAKQSLQRADESPVDQGLTKTPGQTVHRSPPGPRPFLLPRNAASTTSPSVQSTPQIEYCPAGVGRLVSQAGSSRNNDAIPLSPIPSQSASHQIRYYPADAGTPSRQAGSLDDVVIPDVSALVGHRTGKKSKKQ